MTDGRNLWRTCEQFEQIARNRTWSGDLISKEMTRRLRLAKLVKWQDAHFPGNDPMATTGENIGGYVLTWRGCIVWYFWKRIHSPEANR